MGDKNPDPIIFCDKQKSRRNLSVPFLPSGILCKHAPRYWTTTINFTTLTSLNLHVSCFYGCNLLHALGKSFHFDIHIPLAVEKQFRPRITTITPLSSFLSCLPNEILNFSRLYEFGKHEKSSNSNGKGISIPWNSMVDGGHLRA